MKKMQNSKIRLFVLFVTKKECMLKQFFDIYRPSIRIKKPYELDIDPWEKQIRA